MTSPDLGISLESFTTFGAFLKYLRVRAHLNQTDLAIAVGYSTGQLSRLEHNQRLPDLTVVVALFVPALGLENEPLLVARLVELAALARGETLNGHTLSISRTTRLEEISHEHAHSNPSRWPDLPMPTTPLVGRERDIAAVYQQLLRPNVRLLTLVGPPGVGKTRLSMHVALRLYPDFADGIHFIALAALTDAALLLPTIAQALELPVTGERSLLTRLKTLLYPRRMLLILDNFEHILAAAPMLTALLAAAPGLKLLLTSRAVVHVSGEHEYTLLPLDLPYLAQLPPLDQLAQNPAVQLFVARAQAVNPHFALTQASALPVAALCVHLDGLPLALELAAARIKFMPPQALLTRLVHRFQILTTGARDRPARQQTLQRAIDWSHDLLDPNEQILFARLAIFVDGCTEEAARSVCGLPEPAMFEGLASLVDKSLLQTLAVDDEPRFRMLETIRAYAYNQLLARNEHQEMQQRHAAHVLAWAEALGPGLTGPQQGMLFTRLEQEHGNIRAALQWAQQQGELMLGLRIATAIWRFWFLRGYLSEGRRWLEIMLGPSGRAVPTALQAKALNAVGILAVEQGDYAEAATYSEQSLQLYRADDDHAGSAAALTLLGSVALRRGDYPTAASWFTQCLVLRQALRDPIGIAAALNNLGLIAREQGEYAQATTLYQQSLAIKRELGATRGIALALNNLGDVAFDQGAYADAEALFQESLHLFEQLGEKWGIALLQTNLGNVRQAQGASGQAHAHYLQSLVLYRDMGTTPDVSECLEGLAAGAMARQQVQHAARMYGAAAALRESIGAALPPARRAAYDQQLAHGQTQLDATSWTTAWNAGRAMTLAQAIAEALEDVK